MSLLPFTELVQQRHGKLRPPVPQQFLDFSVPQDYAAFLRACDGMENMDDSGWTFWGQSELQPIVQIGRKDSNHTIPETCECPHDFIVFADHLMWAGFLCFRVRRPSTTTPVFYFFGFGTLYPVARDWYDLHYALQHETDDFPYLDAARERLERGISLAPPPPVSVL